MGCCASKNSVAPAPGSVAFAAAKPMAPMTPDMRTKWGPQDLDTLEAEAVAARLRHAQPDGAAVGAAELRAVVERMSEFLGAAHQLTVKWQRVLEGMSAD